MKKIITLITVCCSLAAVSCSKQNSEIEQDGYVERTLGHDARYNELKITQKGRVLVDRTHAIFQEIDAAVFDGFSDEELNLYISCLEKIQWNMQQNATV